jgi:(p)ppGpp synthase/HD superfamily hydrolase
MNKTQQLKYAKTLAMIKHRGQVDKAGIDYFSGHLTRVANSADCVRSKTVAWLHDIIDDTDVTIKDLKALGFSDDIITAVDLLSRHDGVTYFQMIKAISADWLATKVKILDIADHFIDVTAIPDSLIKRYIKAMGILGKPTST